MIICIHPVDISTECDASFPLVATYKRSSDDDDDDGTSLEALCIFCGVAVIELASDQRCAGRVVLHRRRNHGNMQFMRAVFLDMFARQCHWDGVCVAV